MNLREFQRFLEPITGMDKSQIETRVRRLREAGLVPSGGRGRNAPDIDVTHAAFVVMAIAASEYSTDATRMVDMIGGGEAILKTKEGELHRAKKAFWGCRTVLSLLVHLFENREDIEDVRAIQIYPKTATVLLSLIDGTRVFYIRLEERNGELTSSVPEAKRILSQPSWELSQQFLSAVANELYEEVGITEVSHGKIDEHGNVEFRETEPHDD